MQWLAMDDLRDSASIFKIRDTVERTFDLKWNNLRDIWIVLSRIP